MIFLVKFICVCVQTTELLLMCNVRVQLKLITLRLAQIYFSCHCIFVYNPKSAFLSVKEMITVSESSRFHLC